MKKKKIGQAVGVILVIAMVCVFWQLIDYLPVIGDPKSAPNSHVSKMYIVDGPSMTHSPNLVTGVLADFRGFDTLWETTVMFLAGMAVSMILSDKLKRHWDASIFGEIRTFGGADVKAMIPLIVPFILLYAVYVLFHGEVSLGGGFQAGALIALGYILYAMVAGLTIKTVKVTQHLSICLAALGVFIYALTGILPMFNGGKFLDYGRLPFGAEATAELHTTGILMIEVGVTVCVAATIVTILEAVLERKSLHDGNQ
ncbi:MAG: hypothetical protein IKJ77_01735 [Firmicutes bacterium]|nr:hypothetical protein [Bacillota bacterium]